MAPWKHVFVWTLMLALPLQGLLVAAMQLRGPAHVHVEDVADDDDDAHMPHYHLAHHSHADIERHYHSPADGAILVDDDDHQHEALAIDGGSLKADLPGFFAPLIPVAPAVALPDRSNLLADAQAKRLGTRYLGRLERPPRTLSA